MQRLFLLLALGTSLSAQTAALRGVVTDQSGAILPKATVTVKGAVTKTTTTGNDGAYVFTGLPAGEYIVDAKAPQLILAEAQKVTLQTGAVTLNLVLTVAPQQEKVTVEDSAAPSVSTEASANASAVVLKGADLDALSDDPDDLLADLQALAGPAAGPNGGSIFIDGFSGGVLPPKQSIREIRINSNPFSPEYDKLGLGRIEIFTKPGTDKFRGQLGYNFANDALNSRNPYTAQKGLLHLQEFSGRLSGPLGKRASFSVDANREIPDNGNPINAVILAPQTLLATPFTDSPIAQMRRTEGTVRFDYAIDTNNTLIVRDSYNRDTVRNAGTGALNLASRGYENSAPNETLQVTETAVVNSTTVNELRFQYFRPETVAQANTPGYALQVSGAFNGGGNPIGRSTDLQNSYEFQDYVSLIHGKHSWRFGVRLRELSDTNTSPQNYAGTFTFAGGLAPELDANNRPVLDASGNFVMVDVTSIENYRRTLLNLPRQLGGGASQFTIAAGNPVISGRQFDAGAFVGDDWRARPNLTVNLGLRYENQTNISDSRDFAPRIGLAWAPAARAGTLRPKTVLRAGFGMFYDRFSLANTLAARRYNGVTQQQYVISDPSFFPMIPAIATLASSAAPSTVQEVSSSLRAPYLMQSAAAIERQLPRNTTIAVTFASSRGLHLLRSQDINAPLPGTYVPTISGSGVYPLGHPGLVALTESAGLYNQNQLIVNVNTRMTSNISLNASYMYNRASSNTDSLGTFPANPYSMVGEYGPAATDIHHRVTLAGTIMTKWGIRLNPLLTANTGPPFDITAGQDLYGDTLFNGRPGIATDPNKAGVISTPYGLLDPNPTAGERLLSRNAGRGPGQIMLNCRVGKTWSFGGGEAGSPTDPRGGIGREGGGGGGGRGQPNSPFSTGGNQSRDAAATKRYGVTVAAQIRNVMNHNNPGPIIGSIASPLFGQANQAAGQGGGVFSESASNRKIELQMRFTF